MLFNFSNVLVFIFVGVAFVFVALLIGSWIRPHAPNKIKLSSYECGEPAEGPAWMNFNIRFYVLALIFVVFDVEVAFMFPVARVFKTWVDQGRGLLAFLEILAFILILLSGFVYVWLKGDLAWVKNISKGAGK